MYKIAILALNNCMESSITGPYDIFTVASMEWKKSFSQTNEELFHLAIVSDDGRPVNSFTGTTIQPSTGTAACSDLDIIFIPVVYGELDSILANKGLVDWLYGMNKAGAIICAVCAGTFLVAQTGLLDGKTATTHWSLEAEFQKSFPKVLLNKEMMIIDEGDIITAGGVTAYMDLSLYIVGRFGSPELISTLSKLLLIDPSRRLQTPYKAIDYNTAHEDVDILRIQQWLRENISDSFSLSLLAERAGLGQRTLLRRFKKATGNTPIEYLQNLRIGKARTMLETSGTSFDTITYEVGYQDVSSFRRLFKKSTGLSPSAYRKRFGLV